MDHQTASIALSITQLCISVTMIGVYFAAPLERYTRLWAMSGVLTAFGMTIVILSLPRPPGLILAIGNTALFAGCVVVWVGLRAFFGLKKTSWGYILVAAFAAAFFILLEKKAEFATRACFSSASLILVFVLCLQTLRARPLDTGFRKHGYAREMASVGLLVLIIVHVLRMVIFFYTPASLSAATLVQINILLVYLIPLAGSLLFFPALLLLYFERIKHQLLLSLTSKQEALENQTRFVDMFSHEYRTPLAVIRTNLDILQSKEQSSASHMGPKLEKMQRAVLRLVEVAETALQRDPSMERDDVLYEPIAMPDFLHAVIKDAADFWSERAPRLEFQPMQALVFHGNRKLLKTALLNVLDNAIKYGPPQGTVSVQLQKKNDTLILIVDDNGPGVPKEELDLVYGKYFRGSRTAFIAGSGIGLYLVRRIIDQHAGSVSLSNRPEGGTSATITLPLPIEEAQSGDI